jgi:hypothetical protein
MLMAIFIDKTINGILYQEKRYSPTFKDGCR